MRAAIGTDRESACLMRIPQQLTVFIVVIAIAVPHAAAQSASPAAPERPRLNLTVPAAQLIPQGQQPRAAAALHPAAKGAIIGGAIGAGSFGALGLWYCTIGPHEVGECGIEQWVPGLLVWGGVGAGVGALIGAIANRR